MSTTVTITPDCYEGCVIPPNGACCFSTILKIKLLTACNNSMMIMFQCFKGFPMCVIYHNVYLLFTISPLVLLLPHPPTITIVSFSKTVAEWSHLGLLKRSKRRSKAKRHLKYTLGCYLFCQPGLDQKNYQ